MEEASVPVHVEELVDHYDALQVRPEAGVAEIRRAYRRLALETHPDKPDGDSERFLTVANAYETLSDPTLREAYDRKYRDRNRSASAPPPPPRVRLRPARDVAIDLANDLADAGALFIEALDRSCEALSRAVAKSFPAWLRAEVADSSPQFCPNERWRPPAGGDGASFL